MDNQDRAENIIAHGMKNDDSPARIAKHLADYGLLTPDLPELRFFPDTEEYESDVVDGFVNLDGGKITVSYDERDEDTYLTQKAPSPGEIIITDTGQGRAVAYLVLAACDLKDAQDD